MSEQLEKLLASPFEICHEESFNVSQCGMSLFLIPSGVGFFFPSMAVRVQIPKNVVLVNMKTLTKFVMSQLKTKYEKM